MQAVADSAGAVMFIYDIGDILGAIIFLPILAYFVLSGVEKERIRKQKERSDQSHEPRADE